MIEQLSKNIDTEIAMVREVNRYSSLLRNADPTERRIIISSIKSLLNSIKILNNSIPALLSSISLAQKLPGKANVLPLEKIEYGDGKIDVVVDKKDKEKFFSELRISENYVKKMKRKMIKPDEEKYQGIQKASGYAMFSNQFFRNHSERLITKGYFKDLSLMLQKGNFDMLLVSYVSMMLLSTILSFFAGLVGVILLVLLDFPIAKIFWIPIVLPPLTFWFMYIYPSTERDSIAARVDQELPFAVIHMRAISGAGIEPSNIFKIIALSKEYPTLRKEIRKIINQLNLYGYDLVTAMGNVARVTPSTKLSELLIGLTTTINSGGSLADFFEKRSSTLLMGYRLEREKWTKMAETFMDIYITVAIAAPMILMLMLVMLSLTDFEFGFSPGQTAGLVIGAIVVLNVVFLTLLHMKQPKY